MNVSDLIVKGIKPIAIIISLGLPGDLILSDFNDIIEGIIDYCIKFELEYIGGDLNEAKEVIINPTVFGICTTGQIIFRKGMDIGDLLVANGKFGLTGVGFDLLLNKKINPSQYPNFTRSIYSVLEPREIGPEGLYLAEENLATASIDSSDGLAKCLTELMLSNPASGFEIELNSELIDEEALGYSQEFKIPIENLVFNGGEEFIHLFTISPNKYDKANKLIKTHGGQLYIIGKVISEEKIYIKKDGKRTELMNRGYEHFK